MEDLEGWATGRLLSAAARLVEHQWNAHLARWDLNHASLGVLHVLLAGPQTQRELAAAVQVEDQTMSRTVERLERSAYVERRRDETDRRRVVVTLTPRGRGAVLRAGDLRVAESLFEGAIDDLPALREALTGVIRHLSSQRWPAGHLPGAGVEAAQAPGAGVDPGQAPGAGVDPGQAPGADVDAGQAPGAESNVG